MHPTDEMSLHQSVTPFGKNNYVKPPPNKKGENTKTKNNTKQTINTGKKPSNKVILSTPRYERDSNS
jgi:hypothetical protein